MFLIFKKRNVSKSPLLTFQLREGWFDDFNEVKCELSLQQNVRETEAVWKRHSSISMIME